MGLRPNPKVTREDGKNKDVKMKVLKTEMTNKHMTHKTPKVSQVKYSTVHTSKTDRPTDTQSNLHGDLKKIKIKKR